MKRRVTAIALIFWMLLSSCFVILPVAAKTPDVWDGSVASGFAGGDGSEKNPYIIETAEQLAFLAQSVNAGTTYKGKHIRLTADICLNDEEFVLDSDTMLVRVTDGDHTAYLGTGIRGQAGDNEMFDQWDTVSKKRMWYASDDATDEGDYKGVLHAWTPIGGQETPFCGSFDGGGHTVTGVYFNEHMHNVGLLGYLSEGGTVKELRLAQSLLYGYFSVGGIVGNSQKDGNVRYCTAQATVIGYNSVGGVVGMGDVEDCFHLGTVLSERTAGGVLGKGTAERCINDGNVIGGNYSEASANGDGVGGVVGVGNARMCHGGGAVDGLGNTVGGIVGYGSAEFCANEGSVSGYRYIGGIVGIGDAKGCSNKGNVSAFDDVGGIIGGGDAEYCYNLASITARGSESKAGGIVGSGNYPYDKEDRKDTSTVRYCYNLGTVSGNEWVGGIAGANYQMLIYDCYNAGRVNGTRFVGGILGYGWDGYTAERCYNVGKTQGDALVGGVLGTGESKYFKNCYYLGGCATIRGTNMAVKGHGALQEDTSGMVGLLAMEMIGKPVGFDFDAVWENGVTSGYAYPTLKGLHHGDHVFDQQIVSEQFMLSESTCLEAERYYYSCICGMIGREGFLYGKSAHIYDVRSWQNDAVSHWHECSRCAEQVAIEMHAWDKGLTVGKDGVLSFVCTVCNRSAQIDLISDDMESVTKTSVESYPPAVFIFLGIVAGVVGFYAFLTVRDILRKRK